MARKRVEKNMSLLKDFKDLIKELICSLDIAMAVMKVEKENSNNSS